tara:strand:+ start:122 stop:304 length:183 start_codon:yes stop_codon:yes gene_type:complete
MHDEMEKDFPLDNLSSQKLIDISEEIKKKGINNKYDCVVGVSGGRDSSYLLYLVKKKNET